MGGKAKPTKHTAKEIAMKTKEATCNKGGGAAGLADRQGGKAGHSRYLCPICKQTAPDMKSMQNHHESKHPTIPFDANSYEDLHAIHGATTQGVAVRGSTKKK